MNHSFISLDTWARTAVYKHFIQDVRCVISITAKVDVTGLTSFCKSSGYRFYPAFLYLVSKALNGRDEFKMGYDNEGKLIKWHTVSPSYVVFHPEDELFTRLITEYTPDFDVFYRRVISDMDMHKDKRGHEIPYSAKNTFDASCLPWLNYSALDLNVFDGGTYLAPIVTWGKYELENGKLMMPLTMQIHHAVADGFHVSRFYSDIQSEIEALIQ